MQYKSTFINIIILISFGVGLLNAQTRFKDWNASYNAPAGWQLIHQTGNVHAYSDGSQQAIIIVGVGLYESTSEIRNALPQLVQGIFQTYNMRGSASGQAQNTKLHGKSALVANYTATDQFFRQYKARSTSLLSKKKTTDNVFVLAAKERYKNDETRADKILKSVKMSTPQDNQQMMSAVAGSWTYYDGKSTSSIAGSGYTSRSYQETVWFDGRGNYRWSSNGQVSASGRETISGTSSSASGFSANNVQGPYRIIGSTLIVKTNQGQQFAYEIEVRGGAIISNGRYYIRGNG